MLTYMYRKKKITQTIGISPLWILPIAAILYVFASNLSQEVCAQEVFVQTGFEEFSVGKPPEDWDVLGNGFEVTKDNVKTDKNSLGILAGVNEERIGIPIETENSIISVEFWVYIEGGGRSFNFKVSSSNEIAQHNGGVYVNWDADKIRCYDGAAWQHIDDFETGRWIYVRFVTDVSKHQFEFYAGNSRDQALEAKGIKKLPFRNAAEDLVPKWVTFHLYSFVAPGYIDDLLVYEGDEPLNLSVDPLEKLTTTWGHIKNNISIQ